MKRVHLLRFGGSPEELAPLLDAARREGLRIGWLELPAQPGGAGAAPPDLAAAAAAGALRAVAVGPRSSVAVKAFTGPPVLRDVLREHFLGCALVVVREAGEGAAVAPGELAEAPRLEAGDGAYRVTPPGAAARTFDAAKLAARLRRPRPWE